MRFHLLELQTALLFQIGMNDCIMMGFGMFSLVLPSYDVGKTLNSKSLQNSLTINMHHHGKRR